MDDPSAMRDVGKLDPVRRRLLELIERESADMKALSLRLGKNNAYVQQFIDRGTPRELREKDARKLALLLKANPTELGITLDGSSTGGFIVAGSSGPVQASSNDGGREFLTGDQDLPKLGHVRGGEEGFFIDNGELSGYAMRPHILRGVKDAYAVEVYDQSMAPAFKHGHLAWVNPRKPVQPGDDVVVQLHDGQAFIKELVRRTEKEITLRQHNPPKDIKIARDKLRSVHLIVGSIRVAT